MPDELRATLKPVSLSVPLFYVAPQQYLVPDQLCPELGLCAARASWMQQLRGAIAAALGHGSAAALSVQQAQSTVASKYTSSVFREWTMRQHGRPLADA